MNATATASVPRRSLRDWAVDGFLFVLGVVIQGAAVGWGLFIHSRRQLLLSLRDARPGPRPRPGSGPSRPSGAPATRSPGSCTTCSVTGCRC